jgi:hypothetical protein
VRYLCAIILVALAAGLPTTPAAAAPARCFPETGHCIAGSIRSYWERNGGLRVFGYPITDAFTDDVEGTWSGPVQWFERDRLEDHAGEGLGVMAGRLGAAMLELQGRPWWRLPHSDSAAEGCRYFPETGHSLCGAFLRLWQSEGGLPRFGYPLTEPMQESLMDGGAVWTGTVQYFERRRMELRPELAGTPYEVLLGLLGADTFAYAKALKCPQAASPLVALANARGYACASSLPRLQVPIATQSFERGMMIWVSDPAGAAGMIYAIYPHPRTGALTWTFYPDTWAEGVLVPDVGSPPPGLLAPAHGFGLLWATNAELRATLGWATAPEQGDRGHIQHFHVNSGPGKLLIITSPSVPRTYLLSWAMPRPVYDAVEVLSTAP